MAAWLGAMGVALFFVKGTDNVYCCCPPVFKLGTGTVFFGRTSQFVKKARIAR